MSRERYILKQIEKLVDRWKNRITIKDVLIGPIFNPTEEDKKKEKTVDLTD